MPKSWTIWKTTLPPSGPGELGLNLSCPCRNGRPGPPHCTVPYSIPKSLSFCTPPSSLLAYSLRVMFLIGVHLSILSFLPLPFHETTDPFEKFSRSTRQYITRAFRWLRQELKPTQLHQKVTKLATKQQGTTITGNLDNQTGQKLSTLNTQKQIKKFELDFSPAHLRSPF